METQYLCAAYILAILMPSLNNNSFADGHGRLMEPPGRSSLWRFDEFKGYSPRENFDDNQLFCGGLQVQINNGGKCGICGDNWADPQPRANEGGGIYGRGIITRTFKSGQRIPAAVEITTSHGGWVQFKICPNNAPYRPAVQSCLDRYPLHLADGSGDKLHINRGAGWYRTTLQLPPNLTCAQCVVQMHYQTANAWGNCGNGTSEVGCGQQETFRGCSDIAIIEPK